MRINVSVFILLAGWRGPLVDLPCKRRMHSQHDWRVLMMVLVYRVFGVEILSVSRFIHELGALLSSPPSV
jgi:hypothetical protein